MKKTLSTLLLVGVWIIGSSFVPEPEELSKEDRKVIINYLKQTRSELIAKVKSLSEEQWNYKPDPEVWSISEICEHIYKAEAVVLKRVDNLDDKEYKPELMANYKAKEKEIIDFIVGRQTKLNAPERVAPEGSYALPKDFIKEFDNRRSETVSYVKILNKPIKAYYEKFGPIGEVNGYHWLMFISAHTERHMLQLDEVLSADNFPI
jgi:hypothetical protein